ncbi:hypothetical protein BT96DRAFT_1020846 [Gymnopus androsaceus JB14]|uniref:Uncharacterized protein n=1 Tax=Gymnopus androsaceus JB14 TaxID=1447944 RepID=A0A6A4HIU1_9AGAR|nr:hypothetical protein BT96DRAFT_1020846 [Gymnopus androsaceus JB14]
MKWSVTCSCSIYLSHQVSFRVLGEDYHALIRRYQFDVAGTKVEVRKGVEVSVYPTGNSESFVEGGWNLQGRKPLSFKNLIPIRTMIGLGDGNELKVLEDSDPEINIVRSPQLGPSLENSLSTSIRLEFDERQGPHISLSQVQQGGFHDSSQSVSPGEEEHGHNADQWPGWVGEHRKAVDEVETFDDLSAVGFMDEIHAA